MIAENDGPFKHHLDRYKYPERHATDPIKHRAAGLALLTGLEARLAGRANLCRDSRSLTDIAIMPFVRQFAMGDRNWFDSQPLTRVRTWLARPTPPPRFQQAIVRLPTCPAREAPPQF